MVKINDSYIAYIVDQLEHLGMVTVKKMFGGAGLYHDGIIFGVMADDILYFKVDNSNRADYEKVGMNPFKPFEDKPMIMPYYEVPPEVIENKENLASWALKALAVSRCSPSKKRKKKGKGTDCNSTNGTTSL